MEKNKITKALTFIIKEPVNRVALVSAVFLVGLGVYQLCGISTWLFPQLRSGKIFRMQVYSSARDLNSLSDIDRSQKPSLNLKVDNLYFTDSKDLIIPSVGNTGFRENFWLEAVGEFETRAEEWVEWIISSDDGFQLYVNERLVLEFAGVRDRAEDRGTIKLSPGRHQFRLVYFQRFGKVHLSAGFSLANSAKKTPVQVGQDTENLKWVSQE